ncbi:hypothetical protein L1987_35416 [Smallanthus sonchifolius]|uniref:Uncharacterized protein n=1 Tax=Smallanthus sonchifolius TaxID=185202 RepID=A0ACB9HWA2_9ASTR|nr:hypothetical protein L1987_35416 [Smallanthus sonchifolius]
MYWGVPYVDLYGLQATVIVFSCESKRIDLNEPAVTRGGISMNLIMVLWPILELDRKWLLLQKLKSALQLTTTCGLKKKEANMMKRVFV